MERARREAEAPYPVRIPPLMLFVLATALGAYAGWLHVRDMEVIGREENIPFAHGLAMRMPYWYVWALFVPFLLWFARRVPLERMRWPSGVALHLAFAAVVILLHRTLQLAIQMML